MQGPNPGVLLVAALVIVSLGVGAWYFVLRGDGGVTSEFLTAHDRFVAAEHTAEDAMAHVERFAELETFNATIKSQRVVMQTQASTFARIANEQGGDKARLASDASDAATRVLTALDTYAAAILDRRLADAAYGVIQMQGGVAQLDAAATEWKKLQ